MLPSIVSIRAWMHREILTPLDLMYERIDDNLHEL